MIKIDFLRSKRIKQEVEHKIYQFWKESGRFSHKSYLFNFSPAI